MKYFLLATAAVLFSVPALAGTTYEGKVGKLAAVFDITFKEDDIVSGSYSHPKRPGVTYGLIGHNREAGKLYLEEWTGDKLSARCYLEKRLTDTHIIWEGEMRNTDGRTFPMEMKRERNQPAMKKFEHPAYFSRIPDSITWGEPPKANAEVERATMWYEKVNYTGGFVEEYSVADSSTTISLRLAFFPDDDYDAGLQKTDKKLTLTFPRAVPLPRDYMIGEEVWMEVSDEGKVLSINLAELIVTHYRPSPGGKMEVRALLQIDAWNSLNEYEVAADAPALKESPVIEFIPDKVALSHKFAPGADRFFLMQTLRVTEEFGTSIQILEAGPGALELESIALDPPAEGGPWRPVGETDAWRETPLNQRTQQAG